jgi:hypothetical protein
VTGRNIKQVMFSARLIGYVAPEIPARCRRQPIVYSPCHDIYGLDCSGSAIRRGLLHIFGLHMSEGRNIDSVHTGSTFCSNML